VYKHFSVPVDSCATVKCPWGHQTTATLCVID